MYWKPPKALSPATLLLPGEDGAKEDWVGLATRLRQQGYGVLALDFRQPGEVDRGQLLAGVRAGFDFLRQEKKVDAARIGLIGAGLGADAALNFAAQEPLARLAVLLSPGLGQHVLPAEPALADYGFRPLLLVAAEEDPIASYAVGGLVGVAHGEGVGHLYSGEAASGTEMLTAFPKLTEEILTFLRAHL
ncbi:MAG: dienelactone hydrolase family protein [Terriglobia bacterium]